MKTYLLIFFAGLLFAGAAHAQSTALSCTANRTAPPVGSYYWPADSDVKVYFRRAMFTPEQRSTLLGAMQIWNLAAKQISADVRFSYAGETDKDITCEGCLLIARAEVHKYNPEAYAFFLPLRMDRKGRLGLAEIQFDFKTTSPQALQGYMVHELGHGLGLWDCRTCEKKRTVMNGFPGINRDNGLVTPSACDVEVVKEIYRAERSQLHELANRAAASAQLSEGQE